MDGPAARIATLRGYGILDSPNEPGFDLLVRQAATALNTSMALISFLDERRQWFKAKIGLSVTETPLTISFCTHAVRGDGVFVVRDATQDCRFRDNPLVTGAPHVRFYAGASLIAGTGARIGTLCVLDKQPRDRLADTSKQQLAHLAERVMSLVQRRQIPASPSRYCT